MSAYMRPPLSDIPTRGKAGVMPTTYGVQFSPQQIADIVAYLLTLR